MQFIHIKIATAWTTAMKKMAIKICAVTLCEFKAFFPIFETAIVRLAHDFFHITLRTFATNAIELCFSFWIENHRSFWSQSVIWYDCHHLVYKTDMQSKWVHCWIECVPWNSRREFSWLKIRNSKFALISFIQLKYAEILKFGRELRFYCIDSRGDISLCYSTKVHSRFNRNIFHYCNEFHRKIRYLDIFACFS